MFLGAVLNLMLLSGRGRVITIPDIHGEFPCAFLPPVNVKAFSYVPNLRTRRRTRGHDLVSDSLESDIAADLDLR